MSIELKHTGMDALERADAEAVYRHAFECEPLDPAADRRASRSGQRESPRKSAVGTGKSATRHFKHCSATTMSYEVRPRRLGHALLGSSLPALGQIAPTTR